MGHLDYFRGSLSASKLADLSGPSADIKATPCITRQCCDLKVNTTGFSNISYKLSLAKINRQKRKIKPTHHQQKKNSATEQESNATLNYVTRILAFK